MVPLYRQRCKAAVYAVRNRTENVENRTNDFSMRPEQKEAVDKTEAYFRSAARRGLPEVFVELQNAVRQDLCRLSTGKADGLQAGAGAYLQARRGQCVAGGPEHPQGF